MSSFVMTHDDALSYWKALEVHMSPRKTIHAQGIRDELRHLKKSENMSMNDHMIKVRSLADCLAAVGDMVKDHDVIFYCRWIRARISNFYLNDILIA